MFMNKVIKKGIEAINKTAKKVALESTNTASSYLYYEPEAPKSLKKWVSKDEKKA